MTPDIPEPVSIPYLDDDEIRARADEWLAEVHPSGTLPVPIELIVERQGIDIVPLPGLRRTFRLDGAPSLDCGTIYVDAELSETYEARYRFTLAHEMAHVVLHREVISALASVFSTQQWIEANQRLTDATGGSIEYQANCFAGLVLVPPDHLSAVVARVLPDVRAMIQQAVKQGIRKAAALGPAWSELALRIADAFAVSNGVIQRRLSADGFSVKDL